MSVYKRGRLYWYEFVWRVERIRQPTKQTNKRVAEQMEAAHKTALAKGEVGIRDRARIPTLRQFEDRFVKAIETDCSDKPSTIEFYKAKLRYLLDYEPLARCRLSSIDEALVDAFKQHRRNQTSRRGKRLSVASVNRELATLRRLLRLAQKWRVIDRVPKIKMLRGEHEREFVLSFEHEKLYLEMAPGSLRDPAILMLDEGLRVRETRLLEWPDVHITPAPGARFGYVNHPSGKRKEHQEAQRSLDGSCSRVESMAALNPNASRSEVPTKLTTTTKSSRDVKKLSH